VARPEVTTVGLRRDKTIHTLRPTVLHSSFAEWLSSCVDGTQLLSAGQTTLRDGTTRIEPRMKDAARPL
ncbi:MAG: hypothetical protein KDA52_08325, partial [Planctomycetaceae bacterium]|nr:hypothetical protein [Planctomycetaceae bacterium]